MVFESRPSVAGQCVRRALACGVVGLLAASACPLGSAQAAPAPAPDAASDTQLEGAERPRAPERVEVAPRASDQRIAERLQRIFEATGWFVGPTVRVEQGVAFIDGRAAEPQYKEWASDLAQRTEGVVAVVNRIEIDAVDVLNLSPALEGLDSFWRGLARNAPFFLVGLFMLLIAYLGGRAATWIFRASIRRREQADLVRELAARGVGLLVFTLGLYLALRVAGLTRLAATVLGGTGILGLVLGIAFRDMAENVLASLLLTRQQPFRKGDLVEIAGVEGYVQQLESRRQPHSDSEFDHRARDRSDEVLAESLGSAVVNLRVYVWLDGTKHSWLKVQSSVIRLVKRAFQEQGISMPDEAREIVFPNGVPVRLLAEGERDGAPPEAPVARAPRRGEGGEVSTCGEARLETDTGSIRKLAEDSRNREGDQDLLQPVAGRAAGPTG